MYFPVSFSPNSSSSAPSHRFPPRTVPSHAAPPRRTFSSQEPCTHKLPHTLHHACTLFGTEHFGTSENFQEPPPKRGAIATIRRRARRRSLVVFNSVCITLLHMQVSTNLCQLLHSSGNAASSEVPELVSRCSLLTTSNTSQ